MNRSLSRHKSAPLVKERARFLLSLEATGTRRSAIRIASTYLLQVIDPNAGLQAILRKDYDQMDEMFPTTRLSFDEIVARLEELQKRINVLKKP